MHKLNNYTKFNTTHWWKVTPWHRNSISAQETHSCYNIWNVYRDFICQKYIQGNLDANEIWWNILGWGEDWYIKRRREMQAKGKRLTIFSLSNSLSNKWLLQMGKKYPNVLLHYLPDLPFKNFYYVIHFVFCLLQ